MESSIYVYIRTYIHTQEKFCIEKIILIVYKEFKTALVWQTIVEIKSKSGRCITEFPWSGPGICDGGYGGNISQQIALLVCLLV